MEVAGVELLAPDLLVDRAQLRDGELRCEEGRRQWGVLQLGAGSLEPVGEDLRVVEGELPVAGPTPVETDDRSPCGAGGVAAGARIGQIGREGQVGHGDDGHPRVPPRRAVGAELLQVHAAQLARAEPRLLGQFAGGGLVQALLPGLDEAPRQRPAPLEGRGGALDEQHVEPALAHRQHDDVDGQRDRREVPRVVGGEERGLVIGTRGPPAHRHSIALCCYSQGLLFSERVFLSARTT